MAEVKTCRTMQEVRVEIDRLDRELVGLLAERAGYVAQAGRIKQRAEDIRDDARIEEVVAKVRERSRAEGLDPDVAEVTWRAMIEAFIRFEAAVFERREERE